MSQPFAEFRNRISEDWQFLKGWMRKPGAVGSVKPTGRPAAAAMASFVPVESDAPVLELGPGTGVITQAMLERGIVEDRIVGIEHSPAFCGYLRERFPGVAFLEGDAFRAADLLARTPWTRFCAIIGAVPLLNFPRPMRARLIESCLEMMEPGGPFIQISYGPKPPVPPRPGRYSVTTSNWIVKNVPPARIYVYRSESGAR